MKKPLGAIWLFLLFILLSSYAYATSKIYTFLLYPNSVFVETGTLYGDGVQNALLTGFKEIHSIELSPKYYFFTKERFDNQSNIHIHLGDSGKILYEVIREIAAPITFWLDAQFCGHDTARGAKMTPILEELEQIKRHPIKTHTILIDDVRLFGTWYFDHVAKEEILQKLYEINPNYTITYADGFVENDILVAQAR